MEIGCGEGTLAQRLCAAFPDATYVGIDVAEQPGRLFRGDRDRAEFHCLPSGEYLAGHRSEHVRPWWPSSTCCPMYRRPSAWRCCAMPRR